jgi:sec-independent protein translocase protein TatA
VAAAAIAGTVMSVNLGPTELLIILAVVLVLFGGSKLPKLARSLGQAQNEFKQGINEGGSSDDDPADPKA